MSKSLDTTKFDAYMFLLEHETSVINTNDVSFEMLAHAVFNIYTISYALAVTYDRASAKAAYIHTKKKYAGCRYGLTDNCIAVINQLDNIAVASANDIIIRHTSIQLDLATAFSNLITNLFRHKLLDFYYIGEHVYEKYGSLWTPYLHALLTKRKSDVLLSVVFDWSLNRSPLRADDNALLTPRKCADLLSAWLPIGFDPKTLILKEDSKCDTLSFSKIEKLHSSYANRSKSMSLWNHLADTYFDWIYTFYANETTFELPILYQILNNNNILNASNVMNNVELDSNTKIFQCRNMFQWIPCDIMQIHLKLLHKISLHDCFWDHHFAKESNNTNVSNLAHLTSFADRSILKKRMRNSEYVSDSTEIHLQF